MAGSKMYTDLDDVYAKFNIFGRYHGFMLVIMNFTALITAPLCVNYVFVAEEVKYKCISFENSTNSSTCLEWEYENPDSFVAEFELANQDWKRTLVGTIHSCGYMVGLFFVGPLSDRFGRKTILILYGTLGAVIGITKSFSQWYWLYIMLEFLEAAVGDCYSPLFVMNIEMVAKERRVTFHTMSELLSPVSGILFALTAYLVPYWRSLLRVLYGPSFLILSYIFLIDESPRWLLIKGRRGSAIKIIQKAADTNKLKLDKSMLEIMNCDKEEPVSTLKVLKMTFSSRTLLTRFLVCLVWWTTSTFVSYGLAILSVTLPGDKYVNFALTYVVALPVPVGTMMLLNKFGRKKPMIFLFTIAGVLCLTQPLVPSELRWLSILLYMLGSGACGAFFTGTYVYTAELFPTSARNALHALASALGRFGSIAAPQTPLLMHYWYGLPSVVFGCTALVAAACTCLVPDSTDVALPDTVEEAKALGLKDLSDKESGKRSHRS